MIKERILREVKIDQKQAAHADYTWIMGTHSFNIPLFEIVHDPKQLLQFFFLTARTL